jgi:hypothetical protein
MTTTIAPGSRHEHARDAHQSAELLLDHLRRTAGNAEFVRYINQNSAPDGS